MQKVQSAQNLGVKLLEAKTIYNLAGRLFNLRWQQKEAFYAWTKSVGRAVRVVAIVVVAVAVIHIQRIIAIIAVHGTEPAVVAVRASLTTCGPYQTPNFF